MSKGGKILLIVVLGFLANLENRYSVDYLDEIQKVQEYGDINPVMTIIKSIVFYIMLNIVIVLILTKKLRSRKLASILGLILYGFHSLAFLYWRAWDVSLLSSRVYGEHILFLDTALVLLNLGLFITFIVFGIKRRNI